MSTTIGEYIFDNDERVLINRLANGENLKNFSKKKLTDMLKFQLNILSEDSDTEIKSLLSETFSKVDLISEDEWENIKKSLPLPCLDEEVYEETEF